jgi:GntR family transcriptional regulator
MWSSGEQVVGVPIEVAPPKYVQIVNAIQQRIQDGTYAPGTKIPSETELLREFDASRPVVVRALGILEQADWIEAQHGRGRFVRGIPTGGRLSPHLAEVLTRQEDATVQLLSAGPVMAPNRAAVALDVETGTPVIARRRLVVATELGPIELATVYVPVDVAAGTDIGTASPVESGLVRHLRARKGIELDHATERISGRLPTAEEAGLLAIGRRDVLLTLLVTLHDRAGASLVGVDVLIPTSRRELQDVFPLH